MRYFGVIRDELCERAPTPIGAPCGRCEELIVAGDSGIMMPHIGDDGRVDIPMHYECFVRGIVGSVAHQMERCSCFLPDTREEDDPRLTRRQAAELAVALWYYRERRR